MRRIEEIEGAIRSLTPSELGELRRWFAEFDGDAWDRTIEADARAGRLDALAKEAVEDRREGRCSDR